ncbi:MAG: serine/threonine-protein kinase [Gemmatimonadales bacterium]
MDPEERWKNADSILDAALDLPPDQRAAFIAGKCGDDNDLRAHLDSLLRVAKGEGFLDSPAGVFAAGLVVAEGSREDVPDITAGPYRLIRELARGGMGSVYLAERADGQFEQKVALKLIKRGMDSDEVYRRFLSERRILARLSHPNIARLFDGGMTPQGQPWFAMELVDGVSITRYCDEAQSSISQRISLFGSVCQAVRYAHQNLVVHRDLKPSNILVTGSGDVKLLDFGIAKLLADEGGETPATLTELRLMTPEYAAPEQVRGEPVTTATDVYALGAVLYELLSGKRAHRFDRKTAAEIERVVCEVDPEPPSVALSDRDSQARRQVAGDLDTIVLKALDKDPARRYASAEALHEDLRRYEAGLPVTARPDTFGYRARKFARRYRVLVTGAAAVFVTLLAGLGGTLWQSRAASRQASLASAEAAKALQVKSFLVNLFKVTDPAESRGREITARELLERGSLQIDTALSRQPEVQAELLDVLGVINGEIGLLPQADTLLLRSANLTRQLHGDRHPQYLDRLEHRAAVLSNLSRFPEAESILRGTLTVRRAAAKPDRSAIATTLASLGQVVQRAGRFDEAELLLRDAVAMHRRVDANELGVATALHNLAILQMEADKVSAADSNLAEALTIRTAKLGSDHPQVIATHHSRVIILREQGRYDDAEAIERNVLKARRRLYGNEHHTVTEAMNMLALVLDGQGKLAEAESLYTDALAIDRRILGDDNNTTIKVANNLAVLRYRLRDLDGAAEAMRLARDNWTKLLGADHAFVVTATNNLGAILSDRADYAEAEPLIRSALAGRQKQFGDSSSETAQSWRVLGLLLYRTNRYQEAEAALRVALRNYRARHGPGHPRTAEALTGLGMVLTDVGRLNEAEAAMREALAIRTKAFKPNDTRVAEVRGALGHCLTRRRRYREAEDHLRESLRVYRTDARDKPAIAQAQRRLEALASARASQ